MTIKSTHLISIAMKTMTAKEAKLRFGEFLDTMQREPVIITKNNRPVGIMLSIQDATDTLIPEMFLEKEPGYDEWLDAKVRTTQARLESGTTTTREHDEVMSAVWERVLLKRQNNRS